MPRLAPSPTPYAAHTVMLFLVRMLCVLDKRLFQYLQVSERARDEVGECADKNGHGFEREEIVIGEAANEEDMGAVLALIEELHYEAYFLTVYDVVRFAKLRGILCQGRGSAANSAVCYCLGITEIAPETISMVFERFVSEARDEPPDIDVDFEHERREEVIQYIYANYGRAR